MHVIFVEPCFPNYQAKFIEALHQVGATITGIGETPFHAVPNFIKEKLFWYEHVSNVTDVNQMYQAVRRAQNRGWIDRLEATIEAHILPTAKVREACHIPGASVRTAYLCRDKPAMKDALRKAGVPCAASTGADSAAEIRDFAKTVGFPLIIKPPDGAGAAGATKVTNAGELEAAIRGCGVLDGVTVAVEEFIEGHEGFYDTISIKGQVVHEFASHYYPNVLHAMRTRWISPQILTTNRIGEPGYNELKLMGRKVNQALGIETSATHMEWFFGSKGLKFSEIGCRPPGVGMWDLYCAANDFDIYREWAMAVAHLRPSQKLSRRYCSGMIALRPNQDGRISHYDGVEYIFHQYGRHVVDSHFPHPGTPTQPVEAGYWANAWMRLKHPDYDHLKAIMNDIGQRVQVYAH